MSQQHHQIYGSEYQQSQQNNLQQGAPLPQQSGQQNLFNSQINFTRQQYEAWQQYYSQIGAAQQSTATLPQQQLPFMSMGQSIAAQALAAQHQQQHHSNTIGMLQQSHQMLFPQQQHNQQQQQSAPPAAPNAYASASPLPAATAVSGLASLAAHQQYLQQAALIAQQQQQHQQYLHQPHQQLPQTHNPQQQQQPYFLPPSLSQQETSVAAAAHLLAASNPPSTSTNVTPFSPSNVASSFPSSTSSANVVVQQPTPSSSSLQSPLITNTSTAAVVENIQQIKKVSQQQMHQKHTSSSSAQQNPYHLENTIRRSTPSAPVAERVIKSPPIIVEDARLLAQKELDVQAERKAQEEARKSQRVQEELKRRQLDAKEHSRHMQEKIQSIPEPVHLAGCHTLSKVSSFLPFPAEMASTSANMSCFDTQQAQLVLANTDTLLADYLGTLLSDTTDQLRNIELKHCDDEPGDLAGLPTVAPLIQAISAMNQFAFNIEPDPLTSEEGNLNTTSVGGMVVELSPGQINELAEAVLNSSRQQPHSIGGELMQMDEKRVEDIEGLCDQMVKHPKGASTLKRKKDMVESLYDSLSGYYDSKGQKRRISRTKHSETDDEQGSTSNERGSEEPRTPGQEIKKLRGRKRARPPSDGADEKPAKLISNRPPTPTEVIHQREIEWNERQKEREEKYKRRKHTQPSSAIQQSSENWNSDIIAENESFCRFTTLVDQVLEQMDEAMSSTLPCGSGSTDESGLLLERPLLDDLRMEAQKLKAWQKLCEMPVERLFKLLTILEKNIRDVLTENGGALAIPVRARGNEEDDGSDEALKELIDERLLRSVDAALVAMCIMTTKKVPKQILMEEIIERAIQLTKQCLQEVIYPTVDPIHKAQLPKSSSRKIFGVDLNSNSTSRKSGAGKKLSISQLLYGRLIELISCFSELARSHNLTETTMVQLSTLGVPPFFVDNVPEVQVQALKLLPIVFSKCPNLRKSLLYDLSNALHRLPINRNSRNTYRLSAHESIGNFTVLILQLVQSTIQLPTRKSHHGHNHNHGNDSQTVMEDLQDRQVMDSYDEAKRMAAFFLGGFLGKCTAKSEDDFRRLFEQFLQDLLVVLYRPMWPVAEVMLTVLGNLLVVHFRSKSYDLSLRVAAMDYLGIMAARLRKDRVHNMLTVDANTQDKNRLNAIVKSILFDEYSYDPSYNVDDIDISHLSSTEKVRKLEQALFDYIIGTMWDGDVSVEYVLLFYAAEWYRETVIDVEMIKERYTKIIAAGGLDNKERQKYEQKMLRVAEKGQSMKTFIIGLMDKQHLKRRMQVIAKTGNTMVDSDAFWVVKYLASKKDFCQSFDVYLKKILEGFNPDLYPVAIRAKAMKCLAQIVEADHQVLMIPKVNKIVQDRLIDVNASVREATFDLVGKCLVSKPELLHSYFSILVNRTKDTAVAVRKRVIRILRDIVLSREEFDQSAQILCEIVQRVNDEESVKKLCIETFQQLWMQPIYGNKEKLQEKINLLIDTAICCIADNCIEHFESLISLLIKKSNEQSVIQAAKQIVDALVDYVLILEKEVAQGPRKEEAKDADQVTESEVSRTKDFQSRLFATLTTLSLFSKARPELMIRHIEVFVPYLSVSGSSTLEFRVLNQIISMLEQIIPLMDAIDTSQQLVRQLDTRLNEIARDGGMLLIASSISCMSALHAKFHHHLHHGEEQPSICRLFIVYHKYLSKLRLEIEKNGGLNGVGGTLEFSSEKKPNLLRAIYSVGLMSRYFDFDIFLTASQKNALQIDSAFAAVNGNYLDKEAQQQDTCIIRTSVFSLLFYFSRSLDHSIAQKSMIALGQLAAGYPELLRREELKNMYMVLLNTEKRVYLQLKVQVLKNLACFLHSEEQKALKRAEETKKEREQQQQRIRQQQQEDDSFGVIPLDMDEQQEQQQIGPGDLKELELSSSGLSSSIIQQYWNAILNCYFHTDEMVRINAAHVIRQTLEQGLVTPGSSVPTLIAMSTDAFSTIRSRVETLIRDLNAKYKGLILSKAIPGVRLAFKLQKKIRFDSNYIIRGIRSIENPLTTSGSSSTSESKLPKNANDAQSYLGNFYISVRQNRQQRRTFLTSLLKMFSEDLKERMESEEWLFLADNLAHFPFSVMDEPLYVIHQANSIISVSGQNIITQFRELLSPSSSTQMMEGQQHGTPNRKRNSLEVTPQSRSSTSSYQSLNTSSSTEDLVEEFGVDYIMDRMPADRTHVYELKRNSQACFILLHLKSFLMRMYGIKEDKIAEYSPSDAANLHERPLNRKNIPVFSPDFILNELASATIPDDPAIDDRRKIAEDFHKFYGMLLSLDEKGDADDDCPPDDTLDDEATAGSGKRASSTSAFPTE